MLSQRYLRLLFFSFFFYILFYSNNFHILSSRLFIHSSASVILLLIPSCMLFICVHLFFSSSRSLVQHLKCNTSCIFFIVLPSSWIIFTIIILNSFSERSPLSTSFSCFSGVLSCPFVCSYNQILLAFKVKFPGDSQSVRQIPKLGSQM